MTSSFKKLLRTHREKHGESHPATRGRVTQGFAHARTPTSGQTAQEELEECIEQEKRKLEEIQDNPEYDNGIREDMQMQDCQAEWRPISQTGKHQSPQRKINQSDYELQGNDCQSAGKDISLAEKI